MKMDLLSQRKKEKVNNTEEEVIEAEVEAEEVVVEEDTEVEAQEVEESFLREEKTNMLIPDPTIIIRKPKGAEAEALKNIEAEEKYEQKVVLNLNLTPLLNEQG